MKDKLLFYNAYQDFYNMAGENETFGAYCKKAFGENFSQDGFSDINQLNKILSMADLGDDACVLDVGCGNGRMLEYIHNKTGAEIYGFDYSEKAIESAIKRIGDGKNFQVALIGEAVYQKNKFDLITSMDTIYFAPDMPAFVSQVYQWLKPNGNFICGYQEGDIMDKTKNCDTTVLAAAFKYNGLKYTVTDYTKETYEMLKHKREVIISMQDDFKKAGIERWYEVVKNQTDCVLAPYEDYQKKNARYIYTCKKA